MARLSGSIHSKQWRQQRASGSFWRTCVAPQSRQTQRSGAVDTSMCIGIRCRRLKSRASESAAAD
jgi:hypothetical protein